MPTDLSLLLQQYLAIRFPGALTDDFHFLTSGFESDVYCFTLRLPGSNPRALILRLYPGEGAAQKMLREAAGLRLLHPAGYPAPAMLLYETGPAALGLPFTIIDKLEGRSLWPVLAGAAPEQAADLLDRFGALVAHLHRLDWRPFTPEAERYAARPAALLDESFAASRRLYAQYGVGGFLPVVDWLENHLPEITVRPAVVHLDFHANNVFLCADGHLAVIDWTQISVADYRTDLTWTLMLMGDYGQPGWAARILDAYRRAVPYPVEDLDYFNVITYTKLLASTLISLRAGPQELGMRPETGATIKEQVPVIARLARRIEAITGLRVAEVERVLDADERGKR